MQIEVSFVPVSSTPIDALWLILNADERGRAERYRFDDDRRRSIVARGTLRKMLAQRLNRDPRELEFVEGKQGKPALKTGELEFNVSHSGDRVAIAIAEGTPVGIDIEVEQTRMTDLTELARRYFSSKEADVIEAADAEKALELFFTIWTAKESLIKAVGGGLSIELASFSVLPVQTQWGRVENMNGWYVAALPVDEGYRAAIAAFGNSCDIVLG